jgi:phage terminase large subunit-like protein
MRVKKTARQRQAIALMTDPEIRTVLLSGGSRSGKTFIFCYAIVVRALKAAGSRHAILRFHFRDVKNAVGRDTMPKVLKLIGTPYTLDKTDWFFTLPNGSEIWLGGLDDDERVEKILGMEYATIYYNESSQISYHAYTTAQTRLAQKTDLVNRAYVDCNPPTKSHWLYKLFLERIDPETRVPVPNPDRYAVLNMNPMDNRENLPDGYIEDTLASLPERKRRRFLEGEWLDDPEGALWKRSMIDEHRHVGAPPPLARIVVGVDPAVTGSETSDETGIVVVGKDAAGHLYVLGDHSVRGTPLDWARQVAWAVDKHGADRVVGEVNNGGDLVEVNLRTVSKNLPFKKVSASRGKYIRAEPVAALYEKGEVHHVGAFPELEDQMCEWLPGDESPDRMDALVWAITELASGPGHVTIPPEWLSFGGRA